MSVAGYNRACANPCLGVDSRGQQMHLIYNSYATPLSAFFEGLVRVFDWGALLIALRRKQRRIFFENDDPQRNQRLIDRYIVESIAAFESEETEKLSEVPFISRRAFAVADIVLGPLPTDEVIISYEEVVPGAIDRIMGHASQRLQDDSEAEIRHFDNICRQGYRGMVSGFVLTLLLTGSALLLVFLSQLWARNNLGGIQCNAWNFREPSMCPEPDCAQDGLLEISFPECFSPEKGIALAKLIDEGGQQYDHGKSR